MLVDGGCGEMGEEARGARGRGAHEVGQLGIQPGFPGDRAHVERAVEHNEAWLGRVCEALEALGLSVTPSVGNFILIHFPDEDGKRAADADTFLVNRGYVLRQVAAYGLPGSLRMTIGTEEANRGVVDALKAFLG